MINADACLAGSPPCCPYMHEHAVSVRRVCSSYSSIFKTGMVSKHTWRQAPIWSSILTGILTLTPI